MAQTAAKLRPRSKREITVDSLVAAVAVNRPSPAILLTSDIGDLRMLLAGSAVRVEKV